MLHVAVAEAVGDLVDLHVAPLQQARRLLHAQARERVEEGAARLALEELGKVAFADAQRLGHTAHGDVPLQVFAHIGHGCVQIAVAQALAGLRRFRRRGALRQRGFDGLAPLDARAHPVQRGKQLRVVDGLEQIGLHAQKDGAARVVEGVVAGDDDVIADDPVVEPLDQVQPGHLRQAYVRDDQFRPLFEDEPLALHGVGGVPDRREAMLGPGRGLQKAPPQHALILDQYHGVHPRSLPAQELSR